MIDVDKYVREVRYVKGGRIWPNLDCYGPVNYVRADLGLEQWPSWDGVTKDDNGLDKVGSEFVRTREQCDPEEGALACCYTASLMTHVGVVVNTPTGLCVIECNPEIGVTCMPLRRFTRRWLRVEFFK